MKNSWALMVIHVIKHTDYVSDTDRNYSGNSGNQAIGVKSLS